MLLASRDHNATSYSTETFSHTLANKLFSSRDHNATSYSTETKGPGVEISLGGKAEIITLRAIALKRVTTAISLHSY